MPDKNLHKPDCDFQKRQSLDLTSNSTSIIEEITKKLEEIFSKKS